MGMKTTAAFRRQQRERAGVVREAPEAIVARNTVTKAVRMTRLATVGDENLTHEQLEARVDGLRAKVHKMSGAIRALQRRLADADLPANLPGPDEIDAARSSMRASKRKRQIVKTQLARQLAR